MRRRTVALIVAVGALAIVAGAVTFYERRTPDARPMSALPPTTDATPPAPPADRTGNAAVRIPGTKGKGQIGPNVYGAPTVSARELKARLDGGQKTIVVDTQSMAEEPLVESALEVREADVPAWAAKLPKTAYIVAYCTCPEDQSASRAVLELRKLGYESSYVLAGGLDAWQKEGYPTKRGTGGAAPR